MGASILLYGLALLFGATGSTSLDVIGQALQGTSFTDEPLVIAAMALIAGGLAFKASAVPFHMWTPDVYEGAPTTVTAFMSTAVKAAALAAFLRLFTGVMGDLQPDWSVAIAVLATASIVVGNVAALVQTNMKRMLAYSSIAQAGYLLIGVAAGSIDGAEAVLYYLLAYGVMTMAAFAVVIIREREVEDGDAITALTGYGRARPAIGVVLTLSMLSLAGFPPLSGFVGKFLLFGSAVENDLTWLAIVGRRRLHGEPRLLPARRRGRVDARPRRRAAQAAHDPRPRGHRHDGERRGDRGGGAVRLAADRRLPGRRPVAAGAVS